MNAQYTPEEARALEDYYITGHRAQKAPVTAPIHRTASMAATQEELAFRREKVIEVLTDIPQARCEIMAKIPGFTENMFTTSIRRLVDTGAIATTGAGPARKYLRKEEAI